MEWLKSESNTYQEPVCLICRNVVFHHITKRKSKSTPYIPSIQEEETIENILQEKLFDIKIHDEDYKLQVKKFSFGDTFHLL
jgi:hypothetical protein